VGVFESLHFSTKGVREKSQSWKELLLDLKRRVLAVGPELAVADGALGFWQAIEEVWPKTRGQRCWVHKTANVLNKLPKSQQSKAKRALQEIWMAETKNDALVALDAFVETWSVKYDKAVECMIRDRDALLDFYDFPAEHWKHLRTTDEIDKRFRLCRGILIVRGRPRGEAWRIGWKRRRAASFKPCRIEGPARSTLLVEVSSA
jgi:putative transposase